MAGKSQVSSSHRPLSRREVGGPTNSRGTRQARANPRADPREQPAPFEYDSAARAEIEAAVRAVRREPVSDHEWEVLRAAANEYLSSFWERQSNSYLSPSNRAAAWGRAARLCAKLRELIEVVAKNRYEKPDFRSFCEPT